MIHALARGTKRTGELRGTLTGVSQKMLTQTLRSLEAHGLIERTIYPEVPPRVEYALTAMGRSINEPLAGICAWVGRHGASLESTLMRQRGRGTREALSVRRERAGAVWIERLPGSGRSSASVVHERHLEHGGAQRGRTTSC